MSRRSLSLVLPVLSFVAALSFSEAAFAHTGLLGAIGGGFGAGFAHPFFGLDHLLAMVAVGLWAVQCDGRAVWQMPLAFLSMMVIGGIFGMLGLSALSFETGIAATVVILGAAVAAAWRPSTLLGVVLCGIFALLHGHAHGSEMELTASPVLYATGFAFATTLLLGASVGFSRLLMNAKHESVLRWAGAGCSAVGLVLVIA